MNPDGSLALPLSGLGNGNIPDPGDWHEGTLLFRVWWDDPTVVKKHRQDGFIAHDRQTRSFRYPSAMRYWVAKHVNGDTQDSPFISTTLSLFWALALAHKIQKSDLARGKPVQISIIKASMINSDNLYIAYDHIPWSHSYFNIPKLQKFADQSQEVLVLHHIPARAILSTFVFGTNEIYEDWHSYPTLHWTSQFPWVTFADKDDGYKSEYNDFPPTARDQAE